ncbi:hypothetical protein A6R68_18340, partial [Neotoma lepida]
MLGPHVIHEVSRQTPAKLHVFFYCGLHCQGQYSLQEVTPCIALVGGQGEVQRVDSILTFSLMNEAPRKVQQVSRFQHRLQHRLTKVLLAEVGARRQGELLTWVPRSVDTPEFPTFQLQHEGLDVVVVGSKALGVGGREVNVGACHASKLFLEHGQKLPHGGRESLRAEKAQGAAGPVQGPGGGGERAARWVQGLPPPVDVARGVQVLPEVHVLVAQHRVQVGRGEEAFVVAGVLPPHQHRLPLPQAPVEVIRRHGRQEPLEEAGGAPPAAGDAVELRQHLLQRRVPGPRRVVHVRARQRNGGPGVAGECGPPLHAPRHGRRCRPRAHGHRPRLRRPRGLPPLGRPLPLARGRLYLGVPGLARQRASPQRGHAGRRTSPVPSDLPGPQGQGQDRAAPGLRLPPAPPPPAPQQRRAVPGFIHSGAVRNPRKPSRSPRACSRGASWEGGAPPSRPEIGHAPSSPNTEIAHHFSGIYGLPGKKGLKEGPSEPTEISSWANYSEKNVSIVSFPSNLSLSSLSLTYWLTRDAASLPDPERLCSFPVSAMSFSLYRMGLEQIRAPMSFQSHPSSEEFCERPRHSFSRGLHQICQHLSCHHLPLIAFLGSLVSWQLGCASAVLGVRNAEDSPGIRGSLPFLPTYLPLPRQSIPLPSKYCVRQLIFPSSSPASFFWAEDKKKKKKKKAHELGRKGETGLQIFFLPFLALLNGCAYRSPIEAGSEIRNPEFWNGPHRKPRIGRKDKSHRKRNLTLAHTFPLPFWTIPSNFCFDSCEQMPSLNIFLPYKEASFKPALPDHSDRLAETALNLETTVPGSSMENSLALPSARSSSAWDGLLSFLFFFPPSFSSPSPSFLTNSLLHVSLYLLRSLPQETTSYRAILACLQLLVA